MITRWFNIFTRRGGSWVATVIPYFLRFVGRFDAHGASVGLAALPATHPLCGGSGTDNRVAVVSDRYPRQPLVIQGPGAGAEVTAAALLDDVLRISAG